jgi:signal transduction histidine kinase
VVVARRIVGAVPTGTRTTVAVVLDGVAAARPRAAVAVVVRDTVVATTIVAAVGTPAIEPVAGLGPDHHAVLQADVRAVGLVADADPLAHRTVLELAVDDAGAGISDPDAASARGVTRAGSTGLGLDIARRSAEAAGGSLAIERSPLGGARVRLILPIDGASG